MQPTAYAVGETEDDRAPKGRKKSHKMEKRTQIANASILLGLLLLVLPVAAQVIQDPPFGRPDAVIDLASREGAQLVKGQ